MGRSNAEMKEQAEYQEEYLKEDREGRNQDGKRKFYKS